MMRFGLRIEPITSPTPVECATSYATDAGFRVRDRKRQNMGYEGAIC